MSKLVYGKMHQVRFYSEEEKQVVFNYILNNPENVNFKIHENNQNQGAWGSEDRIHFRKKEGVPECLTRQMTAGRGNLYGRINCKELCEELRQSLKM
ncbi:MAG: hypothetical protein IJP62_04270 [Treponema sp.]|nr:hypothetical protein [Treponema sp.]